MPGLLISGPVVGAMRRDSNGTCYEPPNIPADMRCRILERITKLKKNDLKITQNGIHENYYCVSTLPLEKW